MSNEGTPGIPFGFSKPGFKEREKAPQAGEALLGFTASQMENLSARVLSQFAFPDVIDTSSTLYKTLTPEERNTLRAASQPVPNAEAQDRAIAILNNAYERWCEEN